MVIFGDILLGIVALYIFLGVAVAFRFVTVIAPSFSPRAEVGSLLFRAFLIPGAMLLWPMILGVGARGVRRNLRAGEQG